MSRSTAGIKEMVDELVGLEVAVRDKEKGLKAMKKKAARAHG